MEKELLKAFEETITRNVLAAVEHGNVSRELVRELEVKVIRLEATQRQYVEKLELLQTQITSLQVKLFSGGTD